MLMELILNKKCFPNAYSIKKLILKLLDRTVYILATSTFVTCLECGVLSASNTVLFTYIDRNFSERSTSSIFIVCYFTFEYGGSCDNLGKTT